MIDKTGSPFRKILKILVPLIGGLISAAASGADLENESIYRLENVDSGKWIKESGGVVFMASVANTGDKTKWKLIASGTDYRLQNVESGNYIGRMSGNTVTNTKTTLNTSTKWRVTEIDEHYYLDNRYSLDSNNSPRLKDLNSDLVIDDEVNTDASVRWNLVLVGTTPTPEPIEVYKNSEPSDLSGLRVVQQDGPAFGGEAEAGETIVVAASELAYQGTIPENWDLYDLKAGLKKCLMPIDAGSCDGGEITADVGVELDSKTLSWSYTYVEEDFGKDVSFSFKYEITDGTARSGWTSATSLPSTSTPPPTKTPINVSPTTHDAKVNSINSGFDNDIEMGIIEWPNTLQNQIGEMDKYAFITRPKQYSVKLPLIISLHGGGANFQNQTLAQQLNQNPTPGWKLADNVYKQVMYLDPAVHEGWDPVSLDNMLDYVLENFSDVDPDRVYVIGYSRGGGGTYDWIRQSGSRFAAAAPTGFSSYRDNHNFSELVNLPIWTAVGGNDNDSAQRATKVKNFAEHLQSLGNQNVDYREYPGAGHSEAGQNVYKSADLVNFLLGF